MNVNQIVLLEKILLEQEINVNLFAQQKMGNIMQKSKKLLNLYLIQYTNVVKTAMK